MDTPPLRLQRLGLDDTELYFDKFDANRSHIATHDPRLGKSFTTISAVAEQLSPFNAKHRQHFGIMQGNEFVGSTALFLRHNNEAEIAYWIDKDFVGQNLASRACRLMINDATLNLGVRQFDALIRPDNIASIRSVEKLGFHKSLALEEDIVYSLDVRASRTLSSNLNDSHHTT